MAPPKAIPLFFNMFHSPVAQLVKFASVKFRLIDLEAQRWATRRKPKRQRERLSDGRSFDEDQAIVRTPDMIKMKRERLAEMSDPSVSDRE